ncbi:MAG TPA: substrate-binding domain-containing protein [Solirubrobacterales bacterium]|nr:substrate-binding domain-containing protein [Solirubrobacterales bacterium]
MAFVALAVTACGGSSSGSSSGGSTASASTDEGEEAGSTPASSNESTGSGNSEQAEFFLGEVKKVDADLPTYEGGGKVGFSIYTGTVPHWEQQDIPDLETCLETYAPGTELSTADPKAEAELQTQQVSSMLTEGIKALMIAPVSSTPTTIMQDAKQDNVPVIAYVDPIEEAEEGEVVAMIGDGPEPAGEKEAEWVLEQHYPEGTEIALINGDLATQYAQKMQEYQLKTLEPALKSGELKLVAKVGSKNWEGAEAEKEANAILVAHPNVKVIIAGADFLATGIIEALKTEGLVGKVDIVGLEGSAAGLQQMLLGEQKATVIKSSHKEMAVGCVAMISTLNGEEPPKEVFNETWDNNTAPIPFRNTEEETIEKDEINKALEWRIVTKDEVCKGMPTSVGAPCS